MRTEKNPFVFFPVSHAKSLARQLSRAGHRVTFIVLTGKSKDEKPTPKTWKKKLNDAFRELRDESNNDDSEIHKNELGAPYHPVSETCRVLNTVVPDSMDMKPGLPLKKLKKMSRDIDEFVRQRLKYPSKSELCDALSAEQTDAVAMAIYNIEARNQGMIIGDQTGIGKGRIAAAMIRYSVYARFKPVFITEKPNLFSDIFRDLMAIGSGHLIHS